MAVLVPRPLLEALALLLATLTALRLTIRRRGWSRGTEASAWVKEQSQAQDAKVSMADFRASLAKVNKSVGDRDLERFEEWRAEFGAS